MLRNISDTALWTALYRARESERPDALFNDPFARRLAGQRGEEFAASLKQDRSWAFVVRTYLFDKFIRDAIARGTDTILNLAAGLDARPYRMDLPSSLRWFEADLPELLDYKEEILQDDKPRCTLERVNIDLRDGAQRRALFQRVGQNAKNVLVITEGLIIYLAREDVTALAQDLAVQPAFKRWVTDLASPGLVRMMQKELGPHLDPIASQLQFGPPEGPEFFAKLGWKPLAVESHIKVAARVKRGPLLLRLLGMLPESKKPPGDRPWGGVLSLGR